MGKKQKFNQEDFIESQMGKRIITETLMILNKGKNAEIGVDGSGNMIVIEITRHKKVLPKEEFAYK